MIRGAAEPGLPQDPGDYEIIAQQRDVDVRTTSRALEITERFIRDRGLILYGGLAIDYALRLKGASVYPEGERPDYDFYSPRSVDDAYDLADMLQAEGFENVGAVRAIHVQTMRVRTYFVGVADISYTPQEVFDRLPTVRHRGMRVLHPDYQRTDMHLAFCFPFNCPPCEDVFHRFRKDLVRFNLFEQHWPVTMASALGVDPDLDPDSGPLGGAAEGSVRRAVEFAPALGAVHGFAAYALLRTTLEELAKTARARVPELALAPLLERAAALPTPHVEVLAAKDGADRARLVVDLPAAQPVLVLASPWPVKAAEALVGSKAFRRYEPYMDSRPEMLEVEGAQGLVQVYSTRFRMLAVSVLRFAEHEVTVVSAQYLLLYLLHQAHVCGQAGDRRLFVAYYRHTLEMLAIADGLLAAMQKTLPGEAEKFDKIANSTPFVLTTRVIGELNYNAAYQIMLAADVRRSGEGLPQSSVLAGQLPSLDSLPVNYYPDKPYYLKNPRPRFDYAACRLFQRTGREVATAENA